MTFAARLQDHHRAVRGAPFVVIGLALLAARLPLAQHHPALALALVLWLAADSLLLACVATTQGRRPGAGPIMASLAGACTLVALASPPPLQAVLRATPAVLAAIGLVVLAHLALAARRAARVWHGRPGAARWERVAEQFLPSLLVRFARLELTVLHMALLRWGGPADVPPGARAFAYHRHLTPMAVTLLTLSAIEVAVYHIFLGHWSRWAAVAMFVLSDLGLVYLVGLVKSFRFRPILLDGDGLRVRAGFLIDICVPFERIARVTMAVDGAEIRDPATLNAALLAWPNVVVHLKTPLPHGRAWRRRACCRVAFRLDEPEPLVRLLRWRLGQP